MTIDQNQLKTLSGRNVTGSDGQKIGTVGQVYLDDQTGRPEWVTVVTGLFGKKESFVPIAEANLSGDDLQVPYGKAKVKDAPRVDADEGHISEQEEDDLYRYYGLAYGESRADSRAAQGTVGRETTGRSTDAMTRSEEQLHVGTERREAGKARLRKYVVTEQEQVSVPVQREEVRLEREPITEANRDEAMGGPDITEDEHEVTLHEERPVVQKEAVPVERVRLGKDTVTDEVQVDEEVRKERIETEGLEGTVNDDDDVRR